MADGFLSGLLRRAGDVGEELGRRAGDLRDSAEDYGRKGARLARGYGEEGYRRARDVGEEGYRRARDLDTRGELRRLWGQLEDVVEREVAPRASSYARQGRAAAEDAADYVRDATRARPLLAIGIAVAATWVIASIMRGSRR